MLRLGGRDATQWVHDPVGTLNENKGLWRKRKSCNALPARTRKALFLKRFLELTPSEQR